MAKKKVTKRPPGFLSGKDWNGNKNGRPRQPEVEELRVAIGEVEKEKKLKLLKHAIERAYVSDPVLIALLKKILPDKINLSGDITGEVNLSEEDKEALAVLARAIIKSKTGIG